jgi:hypothetical protein
LVILEEETERQPQVILDQQQALILALVGEEQEIQQRVLVVLD